VEKAPDRQWGSIGSDQHARKEKEKKGKEEEERDPSTHAAQSGGHFLLWRVCLFACLLVQIRVLSLLNWGRLGRSAWHSSLSSFLPFLLPFLLPSYLCLYNMMWMDSMQTGRKSWLRLPDLSLTHSLRSKNQFIRRPSTSWLAKDSCKKEGEKGVCVCCSSSFLAPGPI